MLIWIVFNIYWVSMCNLFQIEIFNLLKIFLMEYKTGDSSHDIKCHSVEFPAKL